MFTAFLFDQFDYGVNDLVEGFRRNITNRFDNAGDGKWHGPVAFCNGRVAKSSYRMPFGVVRKFDPVRWWRIVKSRGYSYQPHIGFPRFCSENHSWVTVLAWVAFRIRDIRNYNISHI